MWVLFFFTASRDMVIVGMETGCGGGGGDGGFVRFS